jgi:hypothetical protein
VRAEALESKIREIAKDNDELRNKLSTALSDKSGWDKSSYELKIKNLEHQLAHYNVFDNMQRKPYQDKIRDLEKENENLNQQMMVIKTLIK